MLVVRVTLGLNRSPSVKRQAKQHTEGRGAGRDRTDDRRIMSEARSRWAPVVTSGFSGIVVRMSGISGIRRHHFAPRLIPRPTTERQLQPPGSVRPTPLLGKLLAWTVASAEVAGDD